MIEPRTVFAALRLIIEVNLLLAAALCVARGLAAWSVGSRRSRLRWAQAALVLAFALPVILRVLPHRALVPPAAQVWSGGGAVHSPSVSVTLVGSAGGEGDDTVSLNDRTLALLLVTAVGPQSLG